MEILFWMGLFLDRLKGFKQVCETEKSEKLQAIKDFCILAQIGQTSRLIFQRHFDILSLLLRMGS